MSTWRDESRAATIEETHPNLDVDKENHLHIILKHLRQRDSSKEYIKCTLDVLKSLFPVEDDISNIQSWLNDDRITVHMENGVTKYSFNTTYFVQNKNDIIEQLKKHSEGISHDDFLMNYVTIDQDLQSLVMDGSIAMIPFSGSDVKNRSYFYRSGHYLTPLTGEFSVKMNNMRVSCNLDITQEINYGDCIHIIDKNEPNEITRIYRVNFSPITKEKMTSVAFKSDLSLPANGKWEYTIKSTEFYLDRPYEGPDSSNIVIYKEGVTNDIQRLWLDKIKEIDKIGKSIEQQCQDNNIELSTDSSLNNQSQQKRIAHHEQTSKRFQQ